MRPLTRFPLARAGAIFRVISFVALGGCLWWLARTSTEPWSPADYGALLAWAPMASVIALNQLTWILWPLLLWAWWCWRRDRWSAGALGYGAALGLKPFLGVFLLWLVVTRRWRAAIVSAGTAALTFVVGLVAYGVDVSAAWIRALADVTWTSAVMNASLQGILARTTVARSLALTGSAAIVLITLARTRRQPIDESWQPLMASALLASPLGWLYYIWWLLPGVKPSRLLFETPLLWIPIAIAAGGEPSGWRTLTLGSIYFWGLFMLWVTRIVTAERSVPVRAALVPSLS
jgi:alpha-1,2-mannosyltransferase